MKAYDIQPISVQQLIIWNHGHAKKKSIPIRPPNLNNDKPAPVKQ